MRAGGGKVGHMSPPNGSALSSSASCGKGGSHVTEPGSSGLLLVTVAAAASAQEREAEPLRLPLLVQPRVPVGQKPPFWWIAASQNASGEVRIAATPTEGLPEGALPEESLALNYHFDEPTGLGEMVEAVWIVGLPDCTESISVTFQASEMPHRWALRLVDAKDESFQWNLGGAEYDGRVDPVPGWITRTRRISAETAEASWGGNHDGVLDYPIRFQSLGIVQEGGAALEGEALVAAITVELPPAEELLETAIPVVRFAPAGDGDPPEFEVGSVGATRFDVGTCDPERGLPIHFAWDREGEEGARFGSLAFAAGATPAVNTWGTYLVEYEGDASSALLLLSTSDATEEYSWGAASDRALVSRDGIAVYWEALTYPGPIRHADGTSESVAMTFPARLSGIALMDQEKQLSQEGVDCRAEGTIHLRAVWYVPSDKERTPPPR